MSRIVLVFWYVFKQKPMGDYYSLLLVCFDFESIIIDGKKTGADVAESLIWNVLFTLIRIVYPVASHLFI